MESGSQGVRESESQGFRESDIQIVRESGSLQSVFKYRDIPVSGDGKIKRVNLSWEVRESKSQGVESGCQRVKNSESQSVRFFFLYSQNQSEWT